MTPTTKARSVLTAAGIEIGQDFNSLTWPQREAVIEEAKAAHQAKYGKPLATTKYVRERYDLLQRRARH